MSCPATSVNYFMNINDSDFTEEYTTSAKNCHKPSG